MLSESSIRKLSSLRDVVAGSNKELLVVREIKDHMKGLGIDTRVYPLDVLTWTDLGCSVGGYPCAALPPTLGLDVYGVLTDDLSNCSGKILLIGTTDFPDNVWVLYNLAVEAGAEAVVFYDEFPSRFRRIVVTGVWSYSFGNGSLPPIPAVHVRREDGMRLKELIGKRIEIRCSTDLRPSVGYNVEGFVGGSREGEVAIVAHHDRWFSGFRDNLVGTYTLLKIADKAVLGNVKYTLRLVSFTAEEFGNPNLSPWYWSYGSRVYVGSVDLGNVEYAVNLDTACTEPIRVSATGPDIGKYFVRYASTSYVYEGFDHPYSDGISFSMTGIPTVTLHNMRDIDSIYHTDLDLPYDVESLAERVSRWVINSVNDYELGNLAIRDYAELLRSTLPEDLQDLVDRVLATHDLKALARFLRGVSRRLVRPVIIGSYRDLNKDLVNLLAPHALAISNLRKGVRTGIRISGSEEVLCCERPDEELIGKHIRYLRDVIEELARELS